MKILSRSLILTTFLTTILVTASCAPVPYPNSATNTGNGATVPAPRIDIAKVPVGRPDPQGRPNMVLSPYRPYNIINVKGYRSGSIVGDPSTATVNPATGKLDSRTAKYFRVP